MVSPGTHVFVQRRDKYLGIPYRHHGIAITDAEVIEFGGGDLWNKDKTCVRRVSADTFAGGEKILVVSHPIRWMGLTYSPLLPAEDVVDRGKWLITNQPPPYQLGYRNCESIAIWCATGDFESFQVKKVVSVLPAVGVMGTIIAKKYPKAGYSVAVAASAASLLSAVPYIHSRTLFNHVRAYPGRGRWTCPVSDGSGRPQEP